MRWTPPADGVDARGRVVLRKRLARVQVLGFFANLPRCLISMEACGGAHYWARELTKLGHEVDPVPCGRARRRRAAPARALRAGRRTVPSARGAQVGTVLRPIAG
jgi:transposase